MNNKKLKFWNGRGHGKYAKSHINVAAYSKKQAAQIINQSCNANISERELTVYYSPCWGNSMDKIIATEPCVYIESSHSINTAPTRIY